MRIHGWLWLGALALGVAGCGGDGGPECGAGTIEEDGECVPESTTMCGPGTVDDGTGNCVLEMESSTCGAGTTLNPATGECVADVECGTGTVAMGGTCVPDGSVICADGTIFDTTTGTCLTDGRGACAEGTMLIDGECVLDDDTLVAEVSAAAEQDDPINHEGTPATFTVPEIGAERTLDGCITPVDIDGDGETDVDLDFFAFTVSEPGLYRINADGLGGLAAGFAVEPQEGTLDGQSWLRMGVNYAGDTSERRVYIPAAGDYYLYVFDSRSFDPFSGTFSQPVGGEETCYYVTIEAEALPTPTALPSSLTATGVIGDPAFYTTTAGADGAYRSLQVLEGGGVIPAHVMFRGTDVTVSRTTAAGASATSPFVSSGEALTIVVDYVFSISMDATPFELTLTPIVGVPAEGDLTLTHDDEEPVLVTFAANEGDIAHIQFSSADAIQVGLFGPSYTNGWAPCGVTSGAPTPCVAGEMYLLIGESGTQLVQIFNPSGVDGETYDVSFELTVTTPPTLTPGTPFPITLDPEERTFVRADLTASVWTRAELSAFAGATFTAADVGLHDDVPGPLAAPDEDVGAVSDWFGRIHGLEFGESVLIEIGDPVSVEGDEQVSVTVDEEGYDDVTVVPGTDFTQTGAAVGEGDTLYYFVRAVPSGALTFTVTGAADTTATLTLLDTEVSSITDIVAAGDGEAATFNGLVTNSGWLAFAVTTAAAGMIDILISQEPPPYTVSVGSSTFASICPSEGGAGVALFSGDDAVSTATTFTTFTGFEFFGDAATGYLISSNGWLTFDEAYAGGSAPGADPLGTPDAPNLLVAPLWHDIVSDVCVLEEATRFTVEWNGVWWLTDFGFATEGFVQMQMIADATSDTIEIVYGPDHDLGRETPANPFGILEVGTVGLENLDGDVGIGTGTLDPAAGTSILFTPAP